MKNSNDLRAKRTRRWLKAALSELIKEKQYQKITIAEIATRAEVARNTFYIHYESKDELLLSLFENLFTDLQAELRKELKEGFRDWKFFMILIFKYGQKNVESIQTLLDAGVEHLVESRFLSSVRELTNEVYAIDPVMHDLDNLATYMHDFMMSGIFTVLKRWIKEDMPIPAEKLGQLLGDAAMTFRASRIRDTNLGITWP